MICTKCDRELSSCICEDIDQRIDELSKSPLLAIDWEYIRAERLLNKFEIERDREANKPTQP